MSKYRLSEWTRNAWKQYIIFIIFVCIPCQAMLLNMSGLPNLPHPLPALSAFPPSPLSPLSPPFCSNSHPLIPSPLLSLTLPSDLSSPSRPAFPLTFLDSIVNNKKFLSPCLLPPHNRSPHVPHGLPLPRPHPLHFHPVRNCRSDRRSRRRATCTWGMIIHYSVRLFWRMKIKARLMYWEILLSINRKEKLQ